MLDVFGKQSDLFVELRLKLWIAFNFLLKFFDKRRKILR